MGDLCDVFDLERFVRCEEGRKHLDEIVGKLKGKTIVDVSFSNEVHSVMTIMHLNDGSTLEVSPSDHDVGILRDTFEEEYYKDYPERRMRRKLRMTFINTIILVAATFYFIMQRDKPGFIGFMERSAERSGYHVISRR